MSIFHEMYEGSSFPVDWQYLEVKRMLSEAMSRGFVRQIPALRPDGVIAGGLEEWYQDNETGEIFGLVAPEERMRGRWSKIDLADYTDTGIAPH